MGARRNARAGIVAVTACLMMMASLLPAAAAPTQYSSDRCGRAPRGPAPQGVYLREAIERAGDVDWYRFDVPRASARNVAQVVAGALPADYRLDVFSDCNTRIAGSNQAGRRYEEVILRPAAGPLWVRVRGVGSNHSAAKYRLRMKLLDDGVQLLSRRARVSDGTLRVTGDVVNTSRPSRSDVVVRVVHVVQPPGGDRTLIVDRFTVDRLGPNQRKAFKVSRRLPRHYVRSRISVSQGTVAQGVAAPLTVTDLRARVRGDEVVFRGKIVNRNAYAVSAPQVRLIRFDSLARPIDAETRRFTGTLAPGESRSFVFTVPHLRGVQRNELGAEGMR